MGWYHLVLRIWLVYLSVTEVCPSSFGRAMLDVKYQDLLMSEEFSLENTPGSLEEHLDESSQTIKDSSLRESSRSLENTVIKESSQSLEELSFKNSSQSLEESSLEKSSQSLEESSDGKSFQSLEDSSQSIEKASHSREEKTGSTNDISQRSEKPSSSSQEENNTSDSNDSGKSKREAKQITIGKSKRDAALLSFKSLDDLIDGIEAQVQLGDKSFEFTLVQETVLNAGIDKIRHSITEGDSPEKTEVFIKELETSFSDLTGYNIEMSFITQLRGATVMNEALKQMFVWINMLKSGSIEFSALESKINAYLIKLKTNPDMDPNLLTFLDGIVLNMKSKDFEAGKQTLLNFGNRQQSYLPVDISSHVSTIEGIIPAVEKVCDVKLDYELKIYLNGLISKLHDAIKEKMGEKELATLLHYLERKLKSAAKRTFDLSFLLDLDYGVDVPAVGQTDWQTISVSLRQIISNTKNLAADAVITEIKVWLRKTLATPDLLPEVKIRIEVLLEQIQIETNKNTDPAQLLITLQKDIEGAPTFDPNDLPTITVLLKEIISNKENLPPDWVITDMKVLISKALVCPGLSIENKMKFQIFMETIEEVKGIHAETAVIFKKLTVIVDNQLSGNTQVIGSPPGEELIPDVTESPLETESPLQHLSTQLPIDLLPSNENLYDVNFLTCGGHADATTTWDKNWLPSEAFRGGTQGWHSGRGSKMPQSVWYEFAEPTSVVKVSFSSRNDLRPVKYQFWGSNGPAFDDPNSWTILYEDTALTKYDQYDANFWEHGKQQAFVVASPQTFLTYGFQVIETRCNYCSIKNVHFFTDEPLKELTLPNEEVLKCTGKLKEAQDHMIFKDIDETATLKKISAQLSVITQMANLQQLEPEVAETLPALQKEIDILLSMEKLDKLKLIVRIQPLYRILISCTRVLSGEAYDITGHEFRLNIKLLRMFINKARKEPENLMEWLFFIRTQVMFINININRKVHSDEVIKTCSEIYRLINNIVSDDVNGCLHILEGSDDLCKQVLEELGGSKLAEELPALEIVIRRIFVKLEKGGGKISSVAIFSQMKPWLLLIVSKEEAKGVFSEEAIETCNAMVAMINHIDDFETSYADEYYKFLVRFNIIGWLLNDIEHKPSSFANKDFIQTVEEMDIIWAKFKDLLADQKSLMHFKILMIIINQHAAIMKIEGIGNKINEIIIRILIILKENMKPYEDMKDAQSAAMSVRVMVIRLAYHLKLSLKNVDFCTKVGSSEYYFELNDKLEHRQAMEACAEMGGHLARPGRKDLEQLIEHAKKNTDLINLYLDATDTKKENFFQYATGKELPGDELWECNEPDNKGGNQHCVVISMYSSNRLLGDIGCESPQQYICQIGESEPDHIPECKTVGEGCYVFDKRKRSWKNAVKECKDMGGILASPCGKQLNLLIQHASSHGGRYWIGASDMDKKQKYMYVKGTKMPCGFWAKGEPNQYGGNEPCVEIKGPHKGLNDYGCQADLQFICQFGEDGCDEEKDRKERAENCIKIEDSCYVIETKETLTWEEAKMEAKLYPSGQLAAPDRNEMIRLIDHLHKLGGRYWIGANDRATEGSYHYDDQDHKMPGGFWAKGEPKGDGADEDCVEICAKKGGLADSACNTELNYIVEIIDESAPPKGSDKPECTKFGSSCFWINQWDELTWEEAKKACERTGGYLASPTCPADTKGLLEALHKIGGKYWTGATDSSKEGEYKYVTGNLLIEGHWVCGEPNQGNCKQEDCIGIWSKMKGFYDETCDARLNYVCQYGEVDKQVPEPKDCQTIGTGCFIIEASMRLDWNAAKAKCESVGAKLAHPTKVQMEGLLAHLQPKGDRWWIGGTDSIREGHWTYVNGEHMIGGFWASGEPNNVQNNEHCVEIMACIKKLNDQICTTKLPYVCQVENTGVVPKPVTDPPEPGCKHEKVGSSCFKIEPDDKLTWTAAQKHCEGLGMTLAAPTDEDLQILLTHMSRIGGRYWIGARDYDASFKFSSGSEIPCLWGPGFPEYKDDQKCVEIYAKHKSLSDGKCESERNFICQDLAN